METRRAQGFPDHEVIVGCPANQWKIVGNSVARTVALALGLSLRQAWEQQDEADEQKKDALVREAQEVDDQLRFESGISAPITQREEELAIRPLVMESEQRRPAKRKRRRRSKHNRPGSHRDSTASSAIHRLGLVDEDVDMDIIDTATATPTAKDSPLSYPTPARSSSKMSSARRHPFTEHLTNGTGPLSGKTLIGSPNQPITVDSDFEEDTNAASVTMTHVSREDDVTLTRVSREEDVSLTRVAREEAISLTRVAREETITTTAASSATLQPNPGYDEEEDEEDVLRRVLEASKWDC
jgi:hypothetical protein